MEALTIISSEQIRFLATDWGFEYGKAEETIVYVNKNEDNTMDLEIAFGCDKLVGLQVNVDPNSIGGVAWKREDGKLYQG